MEMGVSGWPQTHHASRTTLLPPPPPKCRDYETTPGRAALATKAWAVCMLGKHSAKLHSQSKRTLRTKTEHGLHRNPDGSYHSFLSHSISNRLKTGWGSCLSMQELTLELRAKLGGQPSPLWLHHTRLLETASRSSWGHCFFKLAGRRGTSLSWQSAGSAFWRPLPLSLNSYLPVPSSPKYWY